MTFRVLSSEESKIECARRHFKAISDNGYIYDIAKDYKSLYDIVTHYLSNFENVVIVLNINVEYVDKIIMSNKQATD